MNDKRKYEIEVTIGTIKLRVPIHKKKQEFNQVKLINYTLNNKGRKRTLKHRQQTAH